MNINFATAGLLLSAQLLAQIAYPTQANTLISAADHASASSKSGNKVEASSRPAGASVTAMRSAAATTLKSWFTQYDEIRKQSQMSDSERSLADDMLRHPLQVLVSERDRQDAHSLLESLTSRYRVAYQQIGELPHRPETQQLQNGYARYFRDARSLFSDALQLQESPFARDRSSGLSALEQLRERKDSLEELQLTLKAIDKRTREEFNIPAYPY